MGTLGGRTPAEWRRILPGVKLPGEGGDLDSGAFQEYERATERERESKHRPGCCSLAICRDQLLQVGSYGWADLEHGHRFKTNTLCRLYCLTKPVVATGLMMLVERGACKLEDEVSKYLPEFRGIRVCARKKNLKASPEDRPTVRKMTLRRLLTHSAGLGYQAGLGAEPEGPGEAAFVPLSDAVDAGRIRSLAELCRAIAAQPLRFQPGERYFYSYGLDVAARVIEVISGKKLDRFLKDEIFRPLGMHDTTFAVPVHMARRGRLAACYAGPYYRSKMGEGPPSKQERHTFKKETVVRVDGARPEDSGWVQGRSCPVQSGGGIMGMNRGGLVSTIEDQARFYLMLLRGGQLTAGGKRFLRPSTVKHMWSTDWLMRPDTVGKVQRDNRRTFGWHAIGEIGITRRPGYYPDAWRIGESGMAGAAATHMTVDPRKGLLVLWFTQNMEGWPGWKGMDQNLWAAVYRMLAKKRAIMGQNANGEISGIPKKRGRESAASGRRVSPNRQAKRSRIRVL